MAKLVFMAEPFAGRVYELALEKTSVGRGDKNTLAIHDMSVSLAHCEILLNGLEVIVRDLGSANGTFVKGIRVGGQCQIKHGQVVRFGSVSARLELDGREAEETDTAETAVDEMQRVMRDQRRERNKPPQPDPSMTLDSVAGMALTDHTVLLMRQQEPVPTQAAEPAQDPPPPSRRRMRIVMIGVAVLGAALLLWWLVWGRN